MIPDAIETDLRAIEAGYPQESQRLREELRQLYARGKLVELVERQTQVATLVAERMAFIGPAFDRLTQAEALRVQADADEAEARKLQAQRQLEADRRTAERWWKASKAVLTSPLAKTIAAGLGSIITAAAGYYAAQWGALP